MLSEKMKEQNNAVFCVGLREPYELRRNVLETLRNVLEILQRFEKFKHIRHEKVERIRKLVALMKETNKLMGKLKVNLPQTNLKGVVFKETPLHTQKTHEHKVKKDKGTEEKQEKVPKKEVTEIDRLESELKSIEGKLRSLQ